MYRTGMLVAVLAAILPHRAAAHEGLRRSVPAKDAVLQIAPTSLRLTFTSRPDLRFTSVRLLGPSNQEVALQPPTLDSATVVSVIGGQLSAGVHTVVWQVAGADGHPVRGRFTFTIAAGASGLDDAHSGTRTGGEAGADVPSPGAAIPPAAHHAPPQSDDAFDASAPGYVGIRWGNFIALAVVVGAFIFMALVLPLFQRRADSAAAGLVHTGVVRGAWLGAAAAAALLVLAVVRLFAQSVAMHGAARAREAPLLSTLVTGTIWGWGWLLQVGGASLALLGFMGLRRARSWGWPVAGIGVLALAVTPALSGHAASAPRWIPLAVTADTLHVIGAGGWLGSLLMVLAVGIPAVLTLGEEHRARAVADLVNAFSPTALIFAGLAAATGVFAAWLHLDGLTNLWTSGYGRVLLLKLAVLSVVAATGAYNWLRVRPALGGPEGAARIRRSSTVEVMVGALVLLVTAVLVATPTPLHEGMAMEP